MLVCLIISLPIIVYLSSKASYSMRQCSRIYDEQVSAHLYISIGVLFLLDFKRLSIHQNFFVFKSCTLNPLITPANPNNPNNLR